MSILSKVKSAAKTVASKVVSGVKTVASAVGGLAKKNVGSAGMAFPLLPGSNLGGGGQTLAPNMTVAPTKTDPGGPGVAYGGGAISYNDLGLIIKQRQAGQSASAMASPIYSSPVTLMGGQKPGTSSSTSSSRLATTSSFAGDSFGSQSFAPQAISSSSLSASSAPISAPSAPSYANPGQINNGGLVGALADGYSYDPNTNTFLPAEQTGGVDSAEPQKRNSLMESLFKMTPQKESVFADKEVMRQQQEVQRQQREVANYTGQLNSVVAQQNADLLRTRGDLSVEGGTEAVYGGIAATINREAAIKALPIQAALAGAQGNLQLAQDYLTQLTTWKTEQINNDYEYKKALYGSISEYVKGEDKRRLDKIEKENDRSYDMTLKNISLQDSLMMKAIEKGMPGLISKINSPNPASPNFRNEIASIASQIAPPSETGAYTEKQEKAITKLNQDVSKNSTYSKTNSMRGYVDNVVASLSQGTGVGDLAAINQFQKVIDEGAVTRDQDVKLIQSSQSLVNTLQTKVKKLQKGEQLSPTLRQQMRSAVEGIYNAQVNALAKDPYIKAKTREAEIYGLTVGDTILGELGSFQEQAPLGAGATGQTSTGLKYQILP